VPQQGKRSAAKSERPGAGQLTRLLWSKMILQPGASFFSKRRRFRRVSASGRAPLQMKIPRDGGVIGIQNPDCKVGKGQLAHRPDSHRPSCSARGWWRNHTAPSGRRMWFEVSFHSLHEGVDIAPVPVRHLLVEDLANAASAGGLDCATAICGCEEAASTTREAEKNGHADHRPSIKHACSRPVRDFSAVRLGGERKLQIPRLRSDDKG